MTHETFDLPNAREPEPDLLTGGQPSRACLEAARAAGYRTLVNLRPAGEFKDFDEELAARENGFDYVAIPIAGAKDLDDEAVTALDAVLADPQRRPALIHCGSGNRVGALFAVHACRKRGLGVDEALTCGDHAGLTKLREAVRVELLATQHDK